IGNFQQHAPRSRESAALPAGRRSRKAERRAPHRLQRKAVDGESACDDHGQDGCARRKSRRQQRQTSTRCGLDMRTRPSPVSFVFLLCLSCAISRSVFAFTEPRPPLLDAAKNGDRETLRTLLKQGANVNLAEADGTTALIWASYRDNLEDADLLIRS